MALLAKSSSLLSKNLFGSAVSTFLSKIRAQA